MGFDPCLNSVSGVFGFIGFIGRNAGRPVAAVVALGVMVTVVVTIPPVIVTVSAVIVAVVAVTVAVFAVVVSVAAVIVAVISIVPLPAVTGIVSSVGVVAAPIVAPLAAVVWRISSGCAFHATFFLVADVFVRSVRFPFRNLVCEFSSFRSPAKQRNRG